ncbi:MAG: hypothetical protein ABI563_14850 [Specibacter sp.]
MKRPTRVAPLALLVCLPPVLAGCIIWPGPVTHYTPAPATLQAKVDCRANSFEQNPLESPSPTVTALMGSVPKGFIPVDAVLCSPGDTASQEIESHLTGDYGPLLAALAESSDNPGEGDACPAMAEFLPDLWLVEAGGRAVHVRWPQTECGFAKPGVRAALDGLTAASPNTPGVSPAP